MTTTDGNYAACLTVTMEDARVKVIAATRDTPADRAGIKSGDFITHIDGRLFYGGTLDEAVERMRGAPGTSVRVTLVRPGRDRPFDVSVTRAIIDIPAVRSEVRDRSGSSPSRPSTATRPSDPAGDGRYRATARRPSARLYSRHAVESGRAARPGVGFSDLSSSAAKSGVSRGRRRTDIDVIMPAPRCRQRCAGDRAGRRRRPRPQRSSPPRCRIIAGRSSWVNEPSAGIGPDPHSARAGTTALRLTTARYYTRRAGRCRSGITPDIEVPQLSDPDYRSRTRVRESDCGAIWSTKRASRKISSREDGRPDPRFCRYRRTARTARDRRLSAPLCAADQLPGWAGALGGGRVAAQPLIRAAMPGDPAGRAPPRRRAGAWRFRRPCSPVPSPSNMSRPSPCEMCWWQRWAHMAALLFALLAACSWPNARSRTKLRLARGSGILTARDRRLSCRRSRRRSSRALRNARRWMPGSTQDVLARILDAPVIRCDQIPWECSASPWRAGMRSFPSLLRC